MGDPRIDQWYADLPEEWQAVAAELRALILDGSPLVKEEWKYNTPFFAHRRWMCYLSLQRGELVLGFVQGSNMSDAAGLFAPTGHRMIRHYRPPPDVDRLPIGALRRTVAEAVAINEELNARRGRSRS